MPIYSYACPNCGLEESRIAGVDDRTVKCTGCDQDMRRMTSDEDLFRAYWETSDSRIGRRMEKN